MGLTAVEVDGQLEPMVFTGLPAETYEANEEIEGVYNYVSYECASSLSGYSCDAGYSASYGTFEVKSDNTWDVCDGCDLDYDPAERSGSWSDNGNGTITVSSDGGDEIATAMLLPSSGGGKVLIIDLQNRTDAGPGMLVGVEKQDLSASTLDGQYGYFSTGQDYGLVTVPDPNGSQDDSYELKDASGTIVDTGTFTRMLPWPGWITTDTGNQILVLPDEGVFLQMDPNDQTWIGVGGNLNYSY